MAISYTEQGWTNNGPPGVSATHLIPMDDALKAAIDALNNMGDAGQQAVKEIGAAPATTTGGKLVNKITEAGYSLAPATGTSNLDNIGDGTSYARVQKALADAINGGTFNAATVSAFGVQATPPTITDCNAALSIGFYRFDSNCTNAPHTSPGALLVFRYDGNLLVQMANQYLSTNIWIRTKYNTGVWSTWGTLWTSANLNPQSKGTQYSVSAAHNTATTIATLSSANASYLVKAYLSGQNAADYHAFAIIQTSSNGTAVINLQNDRGYMFITLSGLNIQVRQTSGATQTVYAVIQRVLDY